jgi:hypothetical protein
MKKALLGGAAALLTMMVCAATASAAAPPATGWLEICKYSTTTNPVSGNFTFTVNGTISVSVATNSCSAPFQVAAGTATVVEASNPYTAVTSISTIPSNRLLSGSLASRTATVSVPAGDISTATTVSYTNTLVDGFVEVCKQAATGSGLTGSFQFTITGAMNFSRTVSVPVGACSDSIAVPAGQVVVAETGAAATYVTSITAAPAQNLLSSNLTAATATVAIVPGDVSTETIVTFTDSPSVLKLCKVSDSMSLQGTDFRFDANGTMVTVPAGGPPGGTCEIVPGIFRAGTQVTISEAVAPGTMVDAITVAPTTRVVGSPNLATRTVTIVLGSGETVVTYDNEPAPPGTLKICKIAGSGVATGSMWTFTIAGMAGSVVVPAGSCVIVGPFPFNSTQTITETPTHGFVVSAIAADPSNRLVGSPDLAAGKASFLIGTGVTEAWYTNSAAPHTSGGGPKPTPTRISFARLVKRAGHDYVVLEVVSQAKHARVHIAEYGRRGKMLGQMTATVATDTSQTLKLSGGARIARVKVALTS